MEEDKFPREYGLLNLLVRLVFEAFEAEVRNASSANVKPGVLKINEGLVLLVCKKSTLG